MENVSDKYVSSPLYTVQRVSGKSRLVHAADNENETRCGLIIDENWYILTNRVGSGKVTCEDCNKKLSKKSNLLEQKYITCENCGDVLSTLGQVEVSEKMGWWFCSPGCAEDKYFDYMKSLPLDLRNLPGGIVIENGKIRKV